MVPTRPHPFVHSFFILLLSLTRYSEPHLPSSSSSHPLELALSSSRLRSSSYSFLPSPRSRLRLLSPRTSPSCRICIGEIFLQHHPPPPPPSTSSRQIRESVACSSSRTHPSSLPHPPRLENLSPLSLDDCYTTTFPVCPVCERHHASPWFHPSSDLPRFYPISLKRLLNRQRGVSPIACTIPAFVNTTVLVLVPSPRPSTTRFQLLRPTIQLYLNSQPAIPDHRQRVPMKL